MKYKYFEQLDRLSVRYDNGGKIRREIINNKEPLKSIIEFEALVDTQGFLPLGEKLTNFIYKAPICLLFKSHALGFSVYILKSANFEFIFAPPGLINRMASHRTDSKKPLRVAQQAIVYN